MWTISPHQIKPVPDKNLFIKGYIYDPGDGTEIPLEPWEIIHFKEFHPTNPFVGLSPIESIAAQAVGDMKATEWNTKFFGESNARLPGILAFADPIADDEWEKLKREATDKSSKREIMFLRNTGAGAVPWTHSMKRPIQTHVSKTSEPTRMP
jgi:phage portal protein BeeE